MPHFKSGDQLYLQSMWSIDHGDDDMDGGIAVFEKFSQWGETIFVHCVGLDRHLNLAIVLENQEKWEKEYGNHIAHMCPEDFPCPNPCRIPNADPTCSLCKGLGYVVGKTVIGCIVCEISVKRRQKILETAAKEK